MMTAISVIPEKYSFTRLGQNFGGDLAINEYERSDISSLKKNLIKYD